MPKQYRSLVLDFSTNLIEAIAEDSKDWAQVNGICMRLSDHKDKSDLTQILPFTLVPSITPKKLFNQAYDVQKDFNELYHQLAFDSDFIETSLVNVIKNDEFTRKLFEIYKRVYVEENCLDKIQSNVLNIQRSDYMFHNDDSHIVREYESKINGIKESTNHHYVLKQVEVNNIAAGGAGLADRVTKMHRRTFQQWLESKAGMVSRIPDNRSLELVSTALAEAWFSYNVPDAILLVVIEPLNQNAMDQRMVEHEFSLLTSARVRRMTLPEISIYGKVDHERGSKLMLRTKIDYQAVEVAIVYFRSGYLPSHYETDADWQIRLDIERSSAIKCPWIGAHLTGTKKVQQVLTESNFVNEFGLSVEQETRMKNTFARMYSLDVNNPKIDQIKAWAMEYPEKFVLKPQREGGGNNIYGPALSETLKNTPADELETFVLMERLDPFVHENILVRADQQLKVIKVDSELGVFGYVLGGRNGIVKQGNFGHIIRTKPSHFDEGGVSTGKAAHDAPFLTWDDFAS